MSLTPAQQQAVAARGNVLVVAGAGTGKTRTLVERCLHCLLAEQPPVSLDEILMVTFTEAAAAEMRQRIRARLEQELDRHPRDLRWHEQVALCDTAPIGTLHSFCLKLIRQHFYELQLDPQLTVLTEEEARLLADETLEDVLQAHYAGGDEAAEAVQRLIQTQGRGWDRPIRELVLKLHHYTQTVPDPDGWFDEQMQTLNAPDPDLWRNWLLETAAGWIQAALDLLNRHHLGNDLAARGAAVLAEISNPIRRTAFAAALGRLLQIRDQCPRGHKTAWLKPLATLFDEADFLATVADTSGGTDPLAEDWNWARPQILTLLRLAREFSRAFASAKRELGALDFHDLEQHALRLLWDQRAGRPTEIAAQWRQRLRFVFVDEYQDINPAQDKIIEALSREGADANRFLVGDVKQSIYRFRLANPGIFLRYAETWTGDRGRTIALTENFRSREAGLTFVNSFFGFVMRPEAGQVAYDDRARLRFGAPAERRPLGLGADPSPRVELRLRFHEDRSGEFEDETAGTFGNAAELEEAGREARLVALRLRELRAERHAVWDDAAGSFRPVEWSDMAVLLRSPANKAESYARVFSRLGVPLVVARGGFYESLEISDLLSLLELLDNPLQDQPLLAVLHSPLVGLTANELAAVRLATPGTHFWMALQRWREQQKSEARGTRPGAGTPNAGADLCAGDGTRKESGVDENTADKVDGFRERFARWRRLARQVSLSRCLEEVLAETRYEDWLLTQPRGEQQLANVRRLLELARQFDQFQRQGLFRFLRFIRAQQSAETGPETAAGVQENAVRLMSIHQSKGLEFPIVALADLAKPFNFADLRAEIILDEKYGLCPQIKPPQTGRRYPSLPYWLARRRQTRETLAEELRLLYVAVTRARDTLILSASLPEQKFDDRWCRPREITTTDLLAARCAADWLGLWFAQNRPPGAGPERSGEMPGMRWRVHEQEAVARPFAGPAGEQQPGTTVETQPAIWAGLRQRLEWRYPCLAATQQPAKTSVSALRRQAAGEIDEESYPWSASVPGTRAEEPSSRPSAADVGTAHHRFLQFVALDRVRGVGELRQEAARLEHQRLLSANEIALLDFDALAAFWNSGFGRSIAEIRSVVRRELAFTTRIPAGELLALTGQPAATGLETEFVIVQGVVDLAVILPAEIRLVDFKTDRMRADELTQKTRLYEPQLKLYARALERIYQRPVTDCRLHFFSPRTTVRVDKK